MPATSKGGDLPFDGYVRVSKVAGREGPSFISPAVQRDAVTRLATAHGLTLGEIVEELDVSGGRAAKDRELERLVRKVEEGKSGGLLVWKVSRISRSLADGVVTAERVRAAGGRILGTDLDTDGPMGKAILGFLLGVAEEELDARRSGWRESQERAAARGAYLSVAPLGYDKDDEGRLVPNGDAPAVSRAFQMRAEGASQGAIQAMFREHGVRVGVTTVANLLKNRAYLGHIVHGEGSEAIYQEDTHPALTDETTWQTAQRSGPPPVRNGSMAGQGVLVGIIECAGCGRPLTVVGSGPADKRRLSYACTNRRRDDPCPAPAGGQVEAIDALVAEGIAERTPEQPGFWEAGWDRAAGLGGAHEEAKAELDTFLEGASIEALGAELFNREVARRREAVQEAWDAFAEAAAAAKATLAEHAGSETARARVIARQALERVVLTKSPTGPGRWGPPVSERIEITWREPD